MKAPAWALIALALLPGGVSGAEDAGDSAAAIEAALTPEMRQAVARIDREVRARERTVRADPQGPAGEKQAAEPPERGDIESMLARVPPGPPSLGDLREQLAVEKSQIVEDNIQEVLRNRTAADMRPLALTYLRTVYYGGNMSTDMGPFIKRVLETPDGWRDMPYMHYGPLPGNIAGLYGGGDITIDPVKGNSVVVLSHELYHHLGHPDEGPSGAYALMGREFGGGGLGDGSLAGGSSSRSGPSFQIASCSR